MIDTTKTAQIVTSNQEVIDAIKTLKKHGLGATLLHAHDKDGNFVDLEPGIMSYEENLQVSFGATPPSPGKYVPVTWHWNADNGSVEALALCRVAQYCKD